MTRVIISLSAHQDLVEILDYLALDNEQAGLMFVDELQSRMKKILEIFPTSGSPFEDDTRYLIIRGRIFVYEYHEASDEVHVLHVMNPGQDWR
jgi:plasmid stabilization system protein ParE